MSDNEPGRPPGSTPPSAAVPPTSTGPTPAGVPGATTAATGGIAAATPPAGAVADGGSPASTAPPRPDESAQRSRASSTARRGGESEPASIGDVVEYVKQYAKQETVGPLSGAGRWIGLGAAGSVTLAIGLSLLLLGLLRVLQAEWSFVDDDSWSWLPYLIVLVVCAGLIAIAVSRINKTFLDKKDQ